MQQSQTNPTIECDTAPVGDGDFMVYDPESLRPASFLANVTDDSATATNDDQMQLS